MAAESFIRESFIFVKFLFNLCDVSIYDLWAQWAGPESETLLSMCN